MLSIDEFSVGSLAQARPLSLMLPRGQYERPFLIGSKNGKAVAIVLQKDGDFRFNAFGCEGADNWSGLLIPGVALQVDEASLHDLTRRDPPLGSIVRSGTALKIVTTLEGWQSQTSFTPVIEDLPDTGSERACFTRWQIVLGTGTDKRILKSIDVTPKAEA
ncbi:hypothetical protein BH09PSE1_BH09PSE1_11320 [soil metagenome]